MEWHVTVCIIPYFERELNALQTLANGQHSFTNLTTRTGDTETLQAARKKTEGSHKFPEDEEWECKDTE